MSRLDPKERIKLALRTEAPLSEELLERLRNPKLIRILHAAQGLATEAGEIMDAVKKHIFYGKPLDEVNLKEEMGDVDWYQSILCDALGTTMKEIEEANIKKLATRYGDKFSEDRAILRDLDRENVVLQQHLGVQQTIGVQKN